MRCVNIDWLEVYCLEDTLSYPHDADFFRERGWEVREREYGTPMYQQMFTLVDQFGEAFCEIRRLPKSDRETQGIFDHYSCHVRLVNRACYANNASQVLALFLEEYGLQYQRISRVDICYDFVRFDYGDEPKTFLSRFMQGRYSKINQARISAHGMDEWDGRMWNSVRWGSPSSPITTRFYNKSMELAEGHDKPYIRQAWQLAGLVDDWHTCEKRNKDGKYVKVEVWRVEFAIKSGTANWLTIEDYNGARKKLRSIRNDLSVYTSREKIWQVFLSLTTHYFHFKYVEYKSKKSALVDYALQAVQRDKLHPLARSDSPATRELQRKDRCRDKMLFRTDKLEVYYEVEKKLSSTPRNPRLDGLLKLLYEYRERQYEDSIKQACNVLIAKIENESRIIQLATPFDEKEIQILRKIIQIRLEDKNVNYDNAKILADEIYRIEREIWQADS